MPTFRLSDRVLTASLFGLLSTLAVAACSTGSGGGAAGSGGVSGAGAGGSGTGGTTADAGTGGTMVVGGAGGTVGGADAGLPTTGVCAGAGTRSLTVDNGKVDDFEAAAILPGWSSFNDVMPAHDVFKIMRAAGGAANTGFAAHYTGMGAITPAMNGFGAGTVYNLAIDHTNMIFCVDITAFDGVTFWAKAATAGAKVGVNFIVPSTNMAPDGDCTAGCFSHPQKTIALTADWAQYSVPFSSAIGGTGARVGAVIQQLGWLTPDSNWDFWLDEIQLYKGTAPTTPVGGNSTM
ncbi:MAG TPA: hypothetical protein VGL59_09885 [Polyangia bacterium]|jgi:hypothetical protein